MCRVLEVSRSGYYAWRNRPESARSLADRKLLARIRRLHYGSDEIYGSPRIHRILAEDGIRVGRKRVARLMRQAGLLAKAKRRFKSKAHLGDKYLVGRRRPDAGALTQANQLWVADITYIRMQHRHVYLASVMDLFNRKIVGWHLSQKRDGRLTREALKNAIRDERPPPGLVFHLDQGIEYASYALRSVLTANGIEQSMSRRGNCYDNAHMESFFHSLKTECLYHYRLTDPATIGKIEFRYIEAFYNRERRHSSLGYLSPLEYQRQHENDR